MIRYSRIIPEIPDRRSSRTTKGIPRPVEAIAHGKQINGYNTGFAALYDTTLKRNLAIGDLTVVSGTHLMSDFFTSGTVGNPTIVYGYHFTGTARVDLDYLTFIGCLFDDPVSELQNGTNYVGLNLEYCTVSPPGPSSTYAVGDQSFSALRCFFRGSSDGLRVNGGATDQLITECYIRIKLVDPGDHSDVLQCDGGAGNVYMLRCRMDLNPEGNEFGIPGSAIFISSSPFVGEVYHIEFINNLMDASTSDEALRLYNGGLASGITYVVTGNRMVRGTAAPVSRGVTNTTPLGNIAWSDNLWDNNDEVIPLV